LYLQSNITQDWLEARVSATPDKLAIVDSDLEYERKTTFRELSQDLGLLTMKLKGAGIGSNATVGLMFSGFLYSKYMLALMRLGCTIVPINTRLTFEEVEWQVKNAQCDFVITTKEFRALAVYLKVKNITSPIFTGGHSTTYADSLDTIKYTDQTPSKPRNINLDEPFAIIHTSGTSGKPKGAVLTYNNIYQSAMASAYRIGVLPDDRWLCVLPLFHVGGLSIILRSLLYGTAVEILPKFDIDAVNQALTEKPITLVSLVPTMLQRLLDTRKEPWNPKLRLVLLGGAAPSPELVQRCVDEGIPLATTYGLSEASSQVATSTPEMVIQKPASVGKPLMFSQVRVIDEHGNEMPTGEVGELIVKSPTVMQGYYKNPEATAETIRDGWLYTGDMGYKDADDDLFIVQRRSDLIVTGGENVYPVEVENAIRQHPAIKEVIVVGINDPEWGQKVSAAVQLEDEKDLLPEEIIAFAREKLAGYKIPRQIRFVTEFPQTGSGKIQRKQVRKVFEHESIDG